MVREAQVAQPTRREIFQAGAVFAGAPFFGMPVAAQAVVHPPATVSDRLWIWGHPAGSHNGQYGLSGASIITPVEAAYYMSIPNMILVSYKGKPVAPFDQYAIPFRSLREVVWSIVGAGGATAAEERESVLRMADESANFTGVDMDDFFFTKKKDGKPAALAVEELEQLQKRLKGGKRKLNLWVTLYTHQLDDPIQDHLKFCDVITLWTWKGADLNQLQSNFAKARKLAPNSRFVLGCYMWDYGVHQPLPVAAMENQCEQGLKWIKQGEIDGMIFLASCICDLGLETVEWSRQWIRKVGQERLPKAAKRS